jgi:hypothetical protein
MYYAGCSVGLAISHTDVYATVSVNMVAAIIRLLGPLIAKLHGLPGRRSEGRAYNSEQGGNEYQHGTPETNLRLHGSSSSFCP